MIPEPVTVHFDGASRGNVSVGHPSFEQSRSSCAFVVTRGPETIHEEGIFLGPGTSNMAELSGCLRALAWCQDHNLRRVHLRGDSRNTILYLTGRYKIPKLPHIASLLFQISQVLAVDSVGDAGPDEVSTRYLRLRSDDPSRVVALSVEHIPRARNARADELAEAALA